MIDHLRRIVAAPATAARLARLAAGAPATTPLCLDFDLGPGDDDWLACLPAKAEYWYWAQPEKADRRLAMGTAQHFSTAGAARFATLANASRGLLADARGETAPQLFFGFAFDPEQCAERPNTRLVLPALLLLNRGGRRRLVLTTTAAQAATAPAHWLDLLAPAAGPAAEPLQRPPEALGERAWLARVQSALRDIAAGQLDKVVLARSARLNGATAIAAGPILAALQVRQPGCTVYAHGTASEVFLGATPERLVRLVAGRADADALAGTAWLAPADLPPPSPLSHDKNRREQAFVENAVAAALAGLCTAVDRTSGQEILHLRQVSHLRTRLGGPVRPGVSLFDLAAALHPTPAVGGSPPAAALEWLRRHDEQRGAWYSGGLGWVDGTGDGEIVVALRCALIAAGQATLWAGAGIVAGSRPEQELAETEAKFQAMLEVFRHPEQAACPPRPERTGTR